MPIPTIDALTSILNNLKGVGADLQTFIDQLNPLPKFSPHIMGQRDPQWANVHLGTAQAADISTIYKYGCVVTSIAYLANAIEGADKYTPVDIQNMLLSVGGFTGDTYNLVAWSAIPKIFPKLKLTLVKDTPDPLSFDDFAALRQRIEAGVPVILGVDYTKTNQKKPNHYVCLTDVLYNGVSVNSLYPNIALGAGSNGSLADPYYADAGPIAPRYGDNLSHAVLRYVIYDKVTA